MSPREHGRRCVECRRRFEPASSARATQRVCGPDCRRLRDNRLAKRRRTRDLDEARADERERQRKHRAAHPTHAPAADLAAPPEPPCHAPPSGAIPPKIQRKILEVWDRESALSRARLEQRLADILAGSAPPRGRSGTADPPVSRATLDAQRAAPQTPS